MRENQQGKGVEAAFATLRPRASQLDRDQVMYLAGKASCESPFARVAWPAATMAATLLAVVFASLHFMDMPQGQNFDGIASRSESRQPVVVESSGVKEVIAPQGEYWSVRNRLLANEINDGWMQTSSDSPATTEQKSQLRVGSRLRLDQLLDPNQTLMEQS